MGIIDKVKNSKVAKAALEKANDYINPGKNENEDQNKGSKLDRSQNQESDQKQDNVINNLKNKI